MFVIPIVLINCLWRALSNAHGSIFPFFVVFNLYPLLHPVPSSLFSSRKKKSEKLLDMPDWLQKTPFSETLELEYKSISHSNARMTWVKEMKLLASHQLSGSLPSYFLWAVHSPPLQPSLPLPPFCLPWSSSMLGWAVNTNYTKSPCCCLVRWFYCFARWLEANV